MIQRYRPDSKNRIVLACEITVVASCNVEVSCATIRTNVSGSNAFLSLLSVESRYTWYAIPHVAFLHFCSLT